MRTLVVPWGSPPRCRCRDGNTRGATGSINPLTIISALYEELKIRPREGLCHRDVMPNALEQGNG